MDLLNILSLKMQVNQLAKHRCVFRMDSDSVLKKELESFVEGIWE